MSLTCGICFHQCGLKEGQKGYCGTRTVRDGEIVSLNYGQITGLALDPIEKKPLARFFPGSRILSLGSWGCNMRCPWCQNDHISRGPVRSERMTAGQIIGYAQMLRNRGNIGIAYTYNEPLISAEFIRDCAFQAHELGLKNVLVTNGMASPDVLKELLPAIDALNIDLKTILPEQYRRIGGDLDTVLENIRLSNGSAHVEVTTLIVPGFNDTEAEMETLAETLAEIDPEIPLHVTRFFPAAEMRGAAMTPVGTVYRMADIARRKLKFVYTGNC
ncbi:MAG: AmmeMemoRadiSam system radical SAM enzyme [Anaerolineaceae bacterium]|nr:AmmeMemoRadiSam system radical SAM enzyme [Anaerolineaceae bacterium]